ncbi:MAG: hypothetical protein ACODAU_10055 [Myxococcota bacterium]
MGAGNRASSPVGKAVRGMGLCAIAAVLGGAPPAWPVAAQKADKDVFIRENTLEIFTKNNRNVPREYRVVVRGRVQGGKRNDAALVEWSKGKRVLRKKRCTLAHNGYLDCQLEGERQTTGEHRLRVTLIDQTTDEKWVALEAQPVVETAETMERIRGRNGGTRDVHVPVYYINHDERMGLAYASDTGTGGAKLMLFFWRSDPPNARAQKGFRCRRAEDGSPWKGYTVRPGRGDRYAQTVKVRRYDPGSAAGSEYTLRGWWRQKLVVDLPVLASSTLPELDGHLPPGQHVCQYRENGVAVRTFSIVVNDEGRLVKPGLQFGRDGLPITSNYLVLHVFFPEEATYGDSFDPVAMRASYGYGRPWPKNAEGLHVQFELMPKGRDEIRRFQFPPVPRGIPAGPRTAN